MKPRLPTALPTSEDTSAWFHFMDRLRPLHVTQRVLWRDACRAADRRDAEMMYWLQYPPASEYCLGCPGGPLAGCGPNREPHHCRARVGVVSDIF